MRLIISKETIHIILASTSTTTSCFLFTGHKSEARNSFFLRLKLPCWRSCYDYFLSLCVVVATAITKMSFFVLQYKISIDN